MPGSGDYNHKDICMWQRYIWIWLFQSCTSFVHSRQYHICVYTMTLTQYFSAARSRITSMQSLPTNSNLLLLHALYDAECPAITNANRTPLTERNRRTCLSLWAYQILHPSLSLLLLLLPIDDTKGRLTDAYPFTQRNWCTRVAARVDDEIHSIPPSFYFALPKMIQKID